MARDLLELGALKGKDLLRGSKSAIILVDVLGLWYANGSIELPLGHVVDYNK
jgi:hypothetical protein